MKELRALPRNRERNERSAAAAGVAGHVGSVLWEVGVEVLQWGARGIPKKPLEVGRCVELSSTAGVRWQRRSIIPRL